MKTILKLVSVFTLMLLAVSCTNGAGTATPVPTPIPTPTTAPSPIVTYDFDAGSPALLVGKSTPFDQLSGGVTAHFSSPSDPAAFSVQNHDTTFLMLPQFSGNYLYQNNPFRTYLHIGFSQPITSITLTFATTDYHGVGEVDEPTAVKLTAYMNTTTVVGSVTARGTFPVNYSFPQGTLSFDSGGNSFNLAVLELLYQSRGGTSFLIDNIIVRPSR